MDERLACVLGTVAGTSDQWKAAQQPVSTSSLLFPLSRTPPPSMDIAAIPMGEVGICVHCRTHLLPPYAIAILVRVMPRLARARRVLVSTSGMRMLVQRGICLYLCMHEIVIDCRPSILQSAEVADGQAGHKHGDGCFS